MGKSKRKLQKKKREEQNLLTIFFAIIAVILLVIAYFTWKQKKHEGLKSAENKPLPEDPRYARLAELEKRRDEKHFERYNIYKNLCDFYAIEKWCQEKIDGVFKFGRRALFLIVLAGFIITRFDHNFLGWSTTDFLKGINAIGVLIFLAFFASSEENDSLMKCYHNSKPTAVRYFMKLIIWRYKIKATPEELRKDLKRVFLELKPIINEISNLNDELNNNRNGKEK